MPTHVTNNNALKEKTMRVYLSAQSQVKHFQLSTFSSQLTSRACRAMSAAICTLLLFGIGTPAAQCAGAAPPESGTSLTPAQAKLLGGTWAGTLTGLTLHLVLRITKEASGKYAATFQSPDQSPAQIPATFTYQGGVLNVLAPEVSGAYTAKVKGGHSLNGTWSQLGHSVGCVLNKK
jgi:hypothetical protein